MTDTAEPLTSVATIRFVVDWTLRRTSDRNDSISVDVDRRSEAVARSIWGHLLKLAGEASIDPLADSIRIRLSWPTRAGDVAAVEFFPADMTSLADLEYQLIWSVARTLERRPPLCGPALRDRPDPRGPAPAVATPAGTAPGAAYA